MANRFMNEGPRWIIVAVWLIANLAVFGGFFYHYRYGIEWYYLNQILGISLPFARSSASCLNLNCMLILMPVCRNLISFVRGSLCCCCYRNVRRQLDKNITFHKYCAYMIVVWTAVHYAAHCHNMERFIEAHNSPNNVTRGLLSALTALPVTTNGTLLNPIRTDTTNAMLELVKLVPGYTGIIITLALLVMVSSATEFIRRSYFEVFWYTHHLFVVFFIALATHGLGGVVKKQINTNRHDPRECDVLYKQWSDSNPQCPIPQFGPKPAQAWMWVIGPIVLYIIERILRFIRSQQKVEIVKVVEHPSRVLELQMKKKGFRAEPGMYIFLHCPEISRLEWHPFTLTSSPQEDYFSVHVRLVGDWTNALAERCKEGGEYGTVQSVSALPSVAVDGPFGTASEDVYQYQTVVLVGAGIGVTPFASVLKDIWYRYTTGDTAIKTRKIYFVWICPDTNAFEWFVDLLKSVENQMIESGQKDFLKYYLCLTRGVDTNKVANILMRSQSNTDPVTGLQDGTYYGRPDWNSMFKEMAEAHQKTRIGVFFCGPKGISTTLHQMCNRHSDSETIFCYNKENF